MVVGLYKCEEDGEVKKAPLFGLAECQHHQEPL